MGAGESVTVVVHGTFAEDETWWKPGAPGDEPNFVDRLNDQLAARGMERSVWRGVPNEVVHLDLDEPAAAPVTEINENFGWSGKNRHRDRVEAAEKLRTSLQRLAGSRERQNGPGPPLRVHLVAHSHGGNVVLEMMKQGEPHGVDVRSITMLGTPLIWSFPSGRFLRMLAVVAFVVLLGGLVATYGRGTLTERLIIGATLLAGPWIFHWLLRALVLAGRALGATWRHTMRGGRVAGRPAYGPRPARLSEDLQNRTILLLRSAEDEADLMMHFGASPRDAYRSLALPSRPRRGDDAFAGRGAVWLLELVVVRPWVYLILVPLVEAGVERFGIGFGWRDTLFRNQEMVSQRDRKQQLYPPEVVERIDVTEHLLETLQREIEERAGKAVYVGAAPDGTGADTEDGIRSEAEHLQALEATFTKLRLSFVEQFNLRHSMYYESDDVIRLVADKIAAAEGSPTSRLDAASSPAEV